MIPHSHFNPPNWVVVFQGDEEAHIHDESFIRALKYGLPPTAGWGLGIDRLVVLFSGIRHIREVVSFPITRPQKTTRPS